MKSIKEKAKEYAKTKHTNLNLIEIVFWDFEAGANYVLECIEEATNICFDEELKRVIEQLKSNS